MSYRPELFPEALRDWGLDVFEMPGWLDRGRPYSFNPIGQMVHHDAFGESMGDLNAANYMTYKGRPDLLPPLCNGAVGNYRTVFLCAAGNANHAGRGLWSVLQRTRQDWEPLGDARTVGGPEEIVGNTHFWGWECRNAGDGVDPWDQLETMETAMAAVADVTGWGCNRIVAHREWTKRKPDPVGFDMFQYRRDCHWKRFLKHLVVPIKIPISHTISHRGLVIDGLEGSYMRVELKFPTGMNGEADMPLDGLGGRPLVPWGKLISVRPHGAYPATDGHWPIPETAEQNRGGVTHLTVEGAWPNYECTLFLIVAE